MVGGTTDLTGPEKSKKKKKEQLQIQVQLKRGQNDTDLPQAAGIQQPDLFSERTRFFFY